MKKTNKKKKDIKFVSTASRRFIAEICLRMVFGFFDERSVRTTASFGHSYCNERYCSSVASHRRVQCGVLPFNTSDIATCSRLENITHKDEGFVGYSLFRKSTDRPFWS